MNRAINEIIDNHFVASNKKMEKQVRIKKDDY